MCRSLMFCHILFFASGLKCSTVNGLPVVHPSGQIGMEFTEHIYAPTEMNPFWFDLMTFFPVLLSPL